MKKIKNNEEWRKSKVRSEPGHCTLVFSHISSSILFSGISLSFSSYSLPSYLSFSSPTSFFHMRVIMMMMIGRSRMGIIIIIVILITIIIRIMNILFLLVHIILSFSYISFSFFSLLIIIARRKDVNTKKKWKDLFGLGEGPRKRGKIETKRKKNEV